MSNRIANIASLKILAIPLFLFCVCSTHTHAQAHPITAIYLKTSSPVVELDGVLKNYSDSVNIFYYNDFVLYELPYEYTKSNVRIVPGEDTSELIDSVIFREIRFNYYAFKKNETIGYLFKSLNDVVAEKKGRVDSVFAGRILPVSDFYLFVKELIKINTLSAGKDDYREIYVPKISGDDGDTVSLGYSVRLKNINFSLSPRLDSISNMKLNKFRVIFNKKLSQKYNVMLPQRELYVEFNELPVAEPQRIKDFFEQRIIYWTR